MNFQHVSFVFNYNNIKVNELNHIRTIIENYNYTYKIDQDVSIVDYKLIRFYNINLNGLIDLMSNINNICLDLFDNKLNMVGVSINGFYLPIEGFDFFLKKKEKQENVFKLINRCYINYYYIRMYVLFNLLCYKKIMIFLYMSKLIATLNKFKCL